MTVFGWSIVVAGGAILVYTLGRSATSKPRDYSPLSLGFSPRKDVEPEPEVPDRAARPASHPFDPAEEEVVIPPDFALPPPKPKLLPPPGPYDGESQS